MATTRTRKPAARAKKSPLEMQQRFEKVLAKHTNTTLRSIDKIIRIAGQRRYTVKEHHCDVVIGATADALRDLDTALKAACHRGESAGTDRRKPVSFARVAQS